MVVKRVTRDKESPSIPEEKVKPVEKLQHMELLPEVCISELPSRFLSYPQGTNIYYRPYTHGEVKRISQSKLPPEDLYILFMKGIRTEGMDKSKLTVPDFMYITILRKLSSLGTENVTLSVICPECRTLQKTTISTSSIEYSELDKVITQLPLVADFQFGTYQFSPLTIGEWIDLKKKNLSTDLIAVMASQVINNEDSYNTIYNNIDGACPEDSSALDEIDILMSHYYKPVKFECSTIKCGNNLEVNIEEEGSQVILTPFRTDKNNPRKRIRFGS